MEMTSLPHRASLFVDAHVHFYDSYSEKSFFESANANFKSAAAKTGEESWLGCLCLTECATDHFFRRLAESLEVEAPEWSIFQCEENISLLACRQDQPRIFLIAGRQIVTGEGLEVLALGTDAEFPDGQSLEETIRSAQNASAVIVLPWGFGKWWFQRGQIIKEFLQTTTHSKIFVGDNGGRPALAPTSPRFAQAAARGFWLLPGSDQLPLPSQVSRTGNYGFILQDVSDLHRPADSLRRRMNNLATQPALFGERVGLASFFWNQMALRLK